MLNRLEDAFISQSAFVSNASHELRNPIAAMIGQAEVTLLKERSPDFYKTTLNAIHTNAIRLKNIVNSLLQLSQASAEQIKAQIEKIRLDELLLDVVENLNRSQKKYKIEVLLPENQTDEILTEGSEGLIEVALTNLIDNVCKYSDGKPVSCILT
jgi:signal transduction histidine kinase